MAIAGLTGFDLIHLEALSQSCVLALLLFSRENWKTYSLSSISCYIFSCRIGITYSYYEDECRINAEFLCSAISWNVAQELIRRPSTQLLVQEPSVWVCQVVRKFVKRKWKQQRIKQDTRVQNWRAMIHWRVRKRISASRSKRTCNQDKVTTWNDKRVPSREFLRYEYKWTSILRSLLKQTTTKLNSRKDLSDCWTTG